MLLALVYMGVGAGDLYWGLPYLSCYICCAATLCLLIFEARLAGDPELQRCTAKAAQIYQLLMLGDLTTICDLPDTPRCTYSHFGR